MTPLDVNTMNHIDGVYAFCAVAATGMLLLLVRVFKQEREKPSRIFEKPSRSFEKPSRIFEKPSRSFEKPSRIKRQKQKRHKQEKARWCGAVEGNVFKSFSCADTRRISGKNGRVPGTASVPASEGKGHPDGTARHTQRGTGGAGRGKRKRHDAGYRP